jgi:hypothetical protein
MPNRIKAIKQNELPVNFFVKFISDPPARSDKTGFYYRLSNISFLLLNINFQTGFGLCFFSSF